MVSHLPFLLLASVTLAAPTVPLPMLNLPTLVQSASDASAGILPTPIEFTQCPSMGNVSSVTVSPCEGGNGTLGSPCEFTFGSNYTITLEFTSTLQSPLPRSNLIANETTGAFGPDIDSYPYSGQSFDGCEYTSCPVQPDVTSIYTYRFRTLKSVFDGLTFNVTDGLEGPSFLCAGFPIKFNP